MLFSWALFACGGDGGGDGDADGGADGATLVVEPGEANLNVEDGRLVEQAYQVFVVDAEGERTEVTAEAALRVDDRRLGTFDGAVFRTSGLRGGRGVVTASFDGLSATAAVIVRVADTRVVDPAPADAADLFDAATDDAALAPQVVYPADGTVVPPNLGDFEAHWVPAAGTDLFELTLRGEYAEVTVYTTGTAADGGLWSAFLPEEWSVVAASAGDETLELSVRALATAAPESAGTATLGIGVTGEDIAGGIYYWASAGGRPTGIYRHDMGAVEQEAEAFYTTVETTDDAFPNGRCVACHVLSRDGSRMAVTFKGGNGPATILDVATRTPMIDAVGGFAWNFASFEPGAERILTVSGGVMSLRQVSDGAVVTTVTTAGYATHPDFNPAGDAVVYAQVAAPTNDWTFTGGQIVTQSFDAATATFGTPAPLASDAGANLYYPSFSPDGKWIIYNRSTQNAYDNATAELYVVAADGSTAPQLLAVPNVATGLTNSWARWAPFAQTVETAGGSEPLFWFTFSSKRAFGVRLAAGRPQIWMAPFYPARAAAGMPASGPAFRLPFQDLGTSNHIAQWTEEVVPIE